MITKILAGAVGGISLAMLKLIDAGFYIHKGIEHPDAITGYMTYLCFVFLGMVVAVFLSEETESEQKNKKDAFILGLLAPSLLIAIVTSPAGVGGGAGLRSLENHADQVTIPQLPSDTDASAGRGLVDWLVGTAYAQVDKDPVLILQKNEFKELRKKDFKSPTGMRFLEALGRKVPSEEYIIVLGQTKDIKTAKLARRNVDNLIKKYSTKADKTDLRVVVKKLEGSNQYVLLLGERYSSWDALAVQKHATRVAGRALMEISNPKERTWASVLLEGQTVNVFTLFKS